MTRRGLGQLAILTADPTAQGNDLPRSSVFVPMMRAVTAALASRLLPSRTVQCGERLLLEAPDDAVLKPDGLAMQLNATQLGATSAAERPVAAGGLSTQRWQCGGGGGAQPGRKCIELLGELPIRWRAAPSSLMPCLPVV